MIIFRQRYFVYFLFFLAGLCGFLVLYWITVVGIGIGPDSANYIEAANNLTVGKGLWVGVEPMTHFPPVYPVLLAILSLFQEGDFLSSSRLLNLFVYSINLVLTGYAVFLSTERSALAAGITILFFLFSEPIMVIHSMAWSEALFISFLLISFICLSLYFLYDYLMLLLTSSLFAGLTITTRYIGITILLPVILAVLIFGKRSNKDRVRDAFIYTLVATIPLILWLVRNYTTAQTLTNRRFVVHLMKLNHMVELIDTIFMIYFPVDTSIWLKVLVLCVICLFWLIAVVILIKVKYIKRGVVNFEVTFPVICTLFFITYTAFLMVSISFIDAHTPFSSRILIPAFLMLAMAGISLTWSLARVLKMPLIWHMFVILASVSILLNSTHSFAKAIDIHNNGLGYTARVWQSSETISYLTNLPYDVQIYSNGPDIIRFFSGVEARIIPMEVFVRTNKTNQNFRNQLSQMVSKTRAGDAVVVYFDRVTWRDYLPSRDDLEAIEDFPVLEQLEDGIIFGKQY